jgi:hypothetical protein
VAGLKYSLDCGPSRPRNLEDWLGFENNGLNAATPDMRFGGNISTAQRNRWGSLALEIPLKGSGY